MWNKGIASGRNLMISFKRMASNDGLIHRQVEERKNWWVGLAYLDSYKDSATAMVSSITGHNGETQKKKKEDEERRGEDERVDALARGWEGGPK